MKKSQEIDFSVFGAQEIRDVLKNRAHCLKAGFPLSHPIIETLNEIRDEYIKRVGFATYLSQMLGPLAVVPVEECTLFAADHQEIPRHLNGNRRQPVQRFIRQHFNLRNLPFKVEFRRGKDSDEVEVRYL